MPITGGAINRTDLVAGTGPHVSGCVIHKFLRRHTPAYRQSASLMLVDDHVHVAEISPAIPARHNRNTNNAIAGCSTLIGHAVEFGDRRVREIRLDRQARPQGLLSDRLRQYPPGRGRITHHDRSLSKCHHEHTGVIRRRVFQEYNLTIKRRLKVSQQLGTGFYRL